MYNAMVYELFPDSSDMEDGSSDALMPVVRSLSPTEKHDSCIRMAYGNLLSSAVEALRCQVINTTNKLHAEQGPDSSRAFLSTLSALCILPTEDFARLCTSIHRASTSFYPNTPPTSHAGFPSADSSKEETTRNPTKGSREEKLERFIANARDALVQLVNTHWEQLAGGLNMQELQGHLFSSDKRMRRVYHYHELRRLRLETELHWLRRALSLIRNLRDFKEYLEENGHRPSDTSNHRLRHAYLVYIYAASFSSSASNMCDIKTAFKEDLRYAVRWMIFIDALGLGAVLVCGESIAKLVCASPTVTVSLY
jgi:hypothetical protein